MGTAAPRGRPAAARAPGAGDSSSDTPCAQATTAIRRRVRVGGWSGFALCTPQFAKLQLVARSFGPISPWLCTGGQLCLPARGGGPPVITLRAGPCRNRTVRSPGCPPARPVLLPVTRSTTPVDGAQNVLGAPFCKCPCALTPCDPAPFALTFRGTASALNSGLECLATSAVGRTISYPCLWDMLHRPLRPPTTGVGAVL